MLLYEISNANHRFSVSMPTTGPIQYYNWLKPITHLFLGDAVQRLAGTWKLSELLEMYPDSLCSWLVEDRFFLRRCEFEV